jgi:hypothetical protein
MKQLEEKNFIVKKVSFMAAIAGGILKSLRPFAP